MRFTGTAYRAHDPRWAFSPLSGAGAALHGGRFNPPGAPTLYLAMSIEGMFAEMGHGLAYRFEPLTVCSYEIDCDDLVDLRDDAGRKAVQAPLDTRACAWALERAERRTPPSWRLAARLIKAGAAGILTPSFARAAREGQHNLVLWRWGPDLPHRVSVHDPAGRLPKDQTSWEV